MSWGKHSMVLVAVEAQEPVVGGGYDVQHSPRLLLWLSVMSLVSLLFFVPRPAVVKVKEIRWCYYFLVYIHLAVVGWWDGGMVGWWDGGFSGPPYPGTRPANSLSYFEASQSNSLFGARSSEARVI